MYLHLGQDTVIKMDEIVGIFNMETSTISKTTRNYLAQAEKAGKVVNVSIEADGVHRRNFQCLKQ